MRTTRRTALSPEFLRPPGFAFSTSDFQATERYGAFLMTPITNAVGMEFECDDPGKFVCEMEFQLFGRASLVAVKRLSRVVCRVADEIAKLGMVSLQICHEGWLSGAQNGRALRAEAGGALLLNMNTATTMGYSDAARFDGIYIDPSSIRPLLKKDIVLSPALISADNSGLKLLSSWLLALSQARISPEDSVRRTIDTHIIDLVVLALDARDDATEEAEFRTGKAARLQAILGLIAARSRTPLSAKSVAAQIGVSERYVRQLLEETGMTFSEHVREHRLVRAYSLLLDPALADKRIAEIAAEAGFNDISYFNRVFRRRFGDTPGSFRGRGPAEGPGKSGD